MKRAVTPARELPRLLWQCRRGLLELDLLLSRFLVERYPELSAAEQHQFRRLLEYPDPTLLAWIQGQEPSPDSLKNIMNNVIQVYDNSYK